MWADPDDPLLVVPVAGQPRVRRLRETEEEREMTGKTGYILLISNHILFLEMMFFRVY